MVGLIDTHAHIFLPEVADSAVLMQDANNAMVEHIVMPNIDMESLSQMIATHTKYPKSTSMLVGLHPCSVGINYLDQLANLKPFMLQEKVVGVGEIGLDYYWNLDLKKEQVKALEIQLQWALDNQIPVSLHTRDATAETIEICKNFSGLRGVFHCFGGTLQQANEIIGLGMSLGIGGVLTFKNSGLAATIAQIDLQHLVLETDTPYLAPHPYRGKQNAPKYLKTIAEKLAEVKGLTLEEVANATSVNARAIFNI